MSENKIVINSFSSLDLLKFAMAIVVVAIHTAPFEYLLVGRLRTYYDSTVIIAVPFFFMCSGFLFQIRLDKYKETEKTILFKRYIYKLIKMYVIWTVIYLPLTIYGFYISNTGLRDSVFYFLRGVFLRGENYYSWPLWYLLSMILCMTFLFFLYKRGFSYKFILLISLVFYFVSICLNSPYIDNIGFSPFFVNLVKASVGSGRLLSGLIFIVLGFYVAYNKNNGSVFFSSLLFVLSCVANYSRIPFLSEFSLISLVYALFCLAVIFPIINNTEVSYWMRKASTVLFFVHMYVVFIIRELLWVKDGLAVFIMTLIVCLFFSFYIIKYQEKYKALQLLF